MVDDSCFPIRETNKRFGETSESYVLNTITVIQGVQKNVSKLLLFKWNTQHIFTFLDFTQDLEYILCTMPYT